MRVLCLNPRAGGQAIAHTLPLVRSVCRGPSSPVLAGNRSAARQKTPPRNPVVAFRKITTQPTPRGRVSVSWRPVIMRALQLSKPRLFYTPNFRPTRKVLGCVERLNTPRLDNRSPGAGSFSLSSSRIPSKPDRPEPGDHSRGAFGLVNLLCLEAISRRRPR